MTDNERKEIVQLRLDNAGEAIYKQTAESLMPEVYEFVKTIKELIK